MATPETDYPTTVIEYSVRTSNGRENQTFTTDDVSDPRAAWNPDVALSYAQHLAVETFGMAIDVNTVQIERLGDPDADKDETGGVPL